MKILLLGGTGYIGSAVHERLTAAGHDVVLLVHDGRPDTGTSSVLGDLADPAGLRAAVTDDVDAVVHAATPLGDWEADEKAIDALLAPLRGTGRALLYLSGVWVLGRTPAGVDESAPQDPIALVSGRGGLEDVVTAAARDGVRGMVLRPGIVHGGGGGIPAMMVGWAREHGRGRHVGEPGVRWPMVHRDDLADLVLLALESGRPGQVLHGVAEQGVRVEELARAADVAARGTGEAQAWPEATAAEALGAPFAEALALDQVVHATAARSLGWAPGRVGAVEDLERGSYAEPRETGHRAGLVQPASAATERREDVDAIVALVAELESAQQDEHILFLHDDVAVANVRQRAVSRDGEPLVDVPEGRPVYVLARRGAGWRLAAGQNTQVLV